MNFYLNDDLLKEEFINFLEKRKNNDNLEEILKSTQILCFDSSFSDTSSTISLTENLKDTILNNNNLKTIFVFKNNIQNKKFDVIGGITLKKFFESIINTYHGKIFIYIHIFDPNFLFNSNNYKEHLNLFFNHCKDDILNLINDLNRNNDNQIFVNMINIIYKRLELIDSVKDISKKIFENSISKENSINLELLNCKKSNLNNNNIECCDFC